MKRHWIMIVAAMLTLSISPMQCKVVQANDKAQSHATSAMHGEQAHEEPVGIHKEAPEIFVGTGKIINIIPKRLSVVISHDEIEGYMRAMKRMRYGVPSAEMLQGLEPGDNIIFRIDTSNRREFLSLEKAP